MTAAAPALSSAWLAWLRAHAEPRLPEHHGFYWSAARPLGAAANADADAPPPPLAAAAARASAQEWTQVARWLQALEADFAALPCQELARDMVCYLRAYSPRPLVWLEAHALRRCHPLAVLAVEAALRDGPLVVVSDEPPHHWWPRLARLLPDTPLAALAARLRVLAPPAFAWPAALDARATYLFVRCGFDDLPDAFFPPPSDGPLPVGAARFVFHRCAPVPAFWDRLPARLAPPVFRAALPARELQPPDVRSFLLQHVRGCREPAVPRTPPSRGRASPSPAPSEPGEPQSESESESKSKPKSKSKSKSKSESKSKSGSGKLKANATETESESGSESESDADTDASTVLLYWDFPPEMLGLHEHPLCPERWRGNLAALRADAAPRPAPVPWASGILVADDPDAEARADRDAARLFDADDDDEACLAADCGQLFSDDPRDTHARLEAAGLQELRLTCWDVGALRAAPSFEPARGPAYLTLHEQLSPEQCAVLLRLFEARALGPRAVAHWLGLEGEVHLRWLFWQLPDPGRDGDAALPRWLAPLDPPCPAADRWLWRRALARTPEQVALWARALAPWGGRLCRFGSAAAAAPRDDSAPPAPPAWTEELFARGPAPFFDAAADFASDSARRRLSPALDACLRETPAAARAARAR